MYYCVCHRVWSVKTRRMTVDNDFGKALVRKAPLYTSRNSRRVHTLEFLPGNKHEEKKNRRKIKVRVVGKKPVDSQKLVNRHCRVVVYTLGHAPRDATLSAFLSVTSRRERLGVALFVGLFFILYMVYFSLSGSFTGSERSRSLYTRIVR